MFLTNSVVVITEFLYSNHFQYQWIGKLKEGTEMKWHMDKILVTKKSAAGKNFL